MESGIIVSKYLERKVQFDIYSTTSLPAKECSLLLFNDGQDLRSMNFDQILTHLQKMGSIKPLIVAGIHAGKMRRQEYGIADIPDYEGRGSRAGRYSHFILQEFLPYLEKNHSVQETTPKAFAGFSLGGLSALDMVWNHPEVFSSAGIFSGSLWWRSKSLLDNYDDNLDRIMHQKVIKQEKRNNLKFFFECGTEDEKYDRNHNGIIDSIDDTLDLIVLLKEKGYQFPGDIFYLEIPGGKHNLATWKAALPAFLQWGWPT